MNFSCLLVVVSTPTIVGLSWLLSFLGRKLKSIMSRDSGIPNKEAVLIVFALHVVLLLSMKNWVLVMQERYFPSQKIHICNISLVYMNFKRKLLSILLPRSEEHTSELQSRFDLVC